MAEGLSVSFCRSVTWQVASRGDRARPRSKDKQRNEECKKADRGGDRWRKEVEEKGGKRKRSR